MPSNVCVRFEELKELYIPKFFYLFEASIKRRKTFKKNVFQ